ncbi:MAG: hypothetical protein WCA36_06725 [Pseudolabrys sp.]
MRVTNPSISITEGAQPLTHEAIQPNNDERIEQIETDGRDNKQVHGGEVRRMIVSPDLAAPAA